MQENMRILYISSKKNWGGVTNWMNQTALGLGERGHDVHIIAHPAGRFVRSASPKLNIIPKKLGMDYNPMMIAYIQGFIREHHIDLMVTNIEKEIMIGGIASRLCRIPNVRRVGREDDFNEKLRVKWHHRWLVDRCIVPCNLIRDNALQRAKWLDGSKFETIYNGRNLVDIPQLDRQRQRRDWGLFDDDFIIGVTAQLIPIKGVDRLMRVFARLLAIQPKCRLVVTGEGRERPGLEKLAGSLNLAAKVVFAGYSDNPIKTAGAYDIAVCPSLFEGFPNTVVEYLAAGRPVVTTDAGGVPEMINHRENGLLVPCDQEDQLFENVLELLQNLDLRKSLQQNARQTILKKFSADIMLDKLEAFFRQTISEYHERITFPG